MRSTCGGGFLPLWSRGGRRVRTVGAGANGAPFPFDSLYLWCGQVGFGGCGGEVPTVPSLGVLCLCPCLPSDLPCRGGLGSAGGKCRQEEQSESQGHPRKCCERAPAGDQGLGRPLTAACCNFRNVARIPCLLPGIVGMSRCGRSRLVREWWVVSAFQGGGRCRLRGGARGCSMHVPPRG